MEKLLLPANCCQRMYFIVAAVFLITGSLNASMVGGESGSYLRYPAGATAMAMGGANGAAPNTLLAWWNPSLLCNVDKKNTAFGGGIRPLGQTDGYAALEFKVPPRMGMGLFILYRGDPFLNNLHDENEKKYPGTSYTTITGKIGLSYYINRKISAGGAIGIRYIRMPSGFLDGSIATTNETGLGSFDFGLTYKYSDRLLLAAQLKNLGASMSWDFSTQYNYSVPSEDNILPALQLSSSYRMSLQKKPLIWNTDVQCFLFDASFKTLPRPEAMLSSGVEWQYWEKLYVRCGIGDLAFNGDILSDADYYWRTFSFRFACGLSYDLSNLYRGLHCNYACSTDKVWAGINQQVDLTLQF